MAVDKNNSDRGGLLRSTAVVSAMTLVSRVLGLVRDMVIAQIFGVSRVTESFFVANKIPNMLRRFFAEGAFSQAFVPVVNEYRAKHGDEEAAELIAKAAGTLGALLLAISLLGVVVAPMLIWIFAPGFAGDDRFDLTVQMLRFTFPYILFVSLSALAGSALNSFGRFAAPAVTPALLNLCLIAGAIWLAPTLSEPGLALAIAVLVAGVVQLTFLLPFMRSLGILRVPKFHWRDAGIVKIRRLMLPALFGSSIVQINMLIDTLIASFLAAGSVSWLYYSDRLMEFPLGVFGIALATVILPRLSSQHAAADGAAFSATLNRGLRLVVLIALPASAGLMVLALPLIATIFYHGAFSADDVRMAAVSLGAFAAGLPAFMMIKILAPGFYARQDTRSPVRYAMVALVVNLVLNLGFVLAIRQFMGSAEHAGLAAATSVAAFVNAILLFVGLQRAGVLQLQSGGLRFITRVSLAVTLMVVSLYLLCPAPALWLEMALQQRVVWVALLVATGAGVYAASAWISGVRRADVLVDSLR